MTNKKLQRKIGSMLRAAAQPINLTLYLTVFAVAALAVAAVSANFAVSIQSSEIAPAPQYTQVADKLSAFIHHEMEDKQLPAMSVALVDDRKIVWARGFGSSDPDKKTAATAETVYRIGSVSKLFTDIGVMQLVERGEIDLDAPVSKYLPDFHPHNPFNKPITLRELMSHRSGLLREPPVGNYFDPSDLSLADMVNSLNDTTLVYEPETHAKYSNAGVATVGYLLEKHSGQPFADYLKHAVLDPMGLHDSAFGPDPRLMPRVSKAYMWSYDGKLFQAPTFELGMAPAGCMYSTVLDLARFESVLFNGGQGPAEGPAGHVLSRETLEKMWTPQFAKPNEKTGFGLGFYISNLDGQREIGHGGAIYGFATQLAALPDLKLGAIAITTMDSSNAVAQHITEEALRLMFTTKERRPLPEIAVTTPVPEDQMRKLEGRYGQGDSALDLFEQDHELKMLPVSGGVQFRLRQSADAQSGDQLIVDGRLAYGPKITASSDALQTGDHRLERATPPAPIQIPDRWKGLIGEYGWDYDTLYIFEKDGKLTALIEWFDYAPLTEASENTFNFPHKGLYDGEQAIFTRDAQGNATQVKVSGVIFKRRPFSSVQNGIFRIQPRESIDALRKEALAAQPPKETGDFYKPDLVELTSLDPTIKLDIRYATTNDFLGTPVYTEAKAFMQRPAAEAVARVEKKLKPLGYGLLIHDAYRPWYVTKIFWDATPDDKRIFVANPSEGSRHNRGCAVDLTLYDLKTGKPIEMTGVYDEMSERSYPFYPGGTSLERDHRDFLRHEMESEGFDVYQYEWWHFDFKDWRHYPILNVTFEQLSPH